MSDRSQTPIVDDSTLSQRFWAKIKRGKPNECWDWLAAKSSGGYGLINIKGKLHGAHRVSWRLINGPIPDNTHILHRCDSPSCVNPDHLFLGTQADNMADMARKYRGRGCSRPCEQNPSAKLTLEQVKAIRIEGCKHGVSKRYLGRAFGVSPQQITRVISGECWKESQ